jgi:hypothetical protein
MWLESGEMVMCELVSCGDENQKLVVGYANIAIQVIY